MKKQAIHSDLFQVFQRVEDGYLEKVKPLLRLISHIEANLLIKVGDNNFHYHCKHKQISDNRPKLTISWLKVINSIMALLSVSSSRILINS